MAQVTRMLREMMNHDFQVERQMRDLKRQAADEMVPVAFEWQLKQTSSAVLFPTYGWVPISCIAWVQRGTGAKLPWSCGRDGDQFLIALRFVPKAPAS
jgi:hypothetical protein